MRRARNGVARPAGPFIRSSRVLSTLKRGARKLVRREPVIDRPRRRGDRLESVGQLVERDLAARRGELRRPLDRLVPDRRPDAVGVAPARRPGQHRGIERNAAGGAERRQHAPRIGEHVLALDHRRRAAEPLRRAVEQFGLGRQTDLLEREIVPLLRIGGEHGLGRADEEGVDEAVAPSAPEFGQHVVRHVLLVPDGLPVRRRPDERVGDLPPVGRLGGDHLLAHRMEEAGRDQIGGVERLVGHRAICSRAERAHHRGRDVARARPHRDAHGRRGAHRPLPSASSASSALTAARRRCVSGPEASPCARGSPRRSSARRPARPERGRRRFRW